MTEEDIAIALREMGISPEEYEELKDPSSVAEMRERLDRFKSKLKRRYKKAVRRLHPDVSEGSKTKFILVNKVYEHLSKMEISAKPRKVKIRIRL